MARKSEKSHNSMISSLVGHLKNNGFTSIVADHIGGAQPENINWKNGRGHIPDVQAIKDGKTHIFEVETDDSIEDPHTADQFELFSEAAKTWANYIFYILVPVASKAKLDRILQNLKISNANVLTI